jgi:dihydroneopterin aldolase
VNERYDQNQPSRVNAAAGLRHVFVRDLEVMATLGIHEHEKFTPQRIIVSIDVVREGNDPVHDDISNVVSYEIIVKKWKQSLRRAM